MAKVEGHVGGQDTCVILVGRGWLGILKYENI